MNAVDVRVTVVARTPLARAGVARLAAAVVRAERAQVAALSITFVGAARMRALNRSHFGKDRETAVIAFALKPTGRRTDGPTDRSAVVGDVYICPAVAALEARRAGTTLKNELRRLVVHGVLHALGYDHPAGAARRLTSAMWRRQERHVRALGRLAR